MTKVNCKAKDPKNCRFHGTGKFEVSDTSTHEMSAKEARVAYLTTPEGIQELRNKGKHELADKYEARRKRLEIEAEKEALKNKVPLRLAVDLDETSGGFINALRESVAAQRGITLEEAKKELPFPEHYSLVDSGWFKDVNHFMDEFHEAERQGVYRKMVAFKDMSRTLRTLVSNRDVEVHVVTAREMEWNSDTRYWLRKNRVPFRSITHTESKEETDMDVYIDDSDKQLKTLQSHGKTVIAFDNLTNDHVQTPHRVRSWKEVPSVLKVIAENRN
jgi:5'(3')-deoxyribonucleotidase